MNPLDPRSAAPFPAEGAGDDPRLGQALDEYLTALEAGRAPDRQEFLARHAAIAPHLAECLRGLEFVRQAADALDEPAEAPAAEVVRDAESSPPATLGDFRIVRQVGRGGMGVVYEAEQISLGRRVALKVLPLAAALDARQLQRFKNEAQAAAHLQHTNIVPVYFVGCERGVHFYAMQYVEGQTLAALTTDLRRQGERPAEPLVATGPYVPSTEPAASGDAGSGAAVTQPLAGLSTMHSHREPAFFRAVAQLAIQAAEALEHAHQMGVVHRDIKPGNLMVDGRGTLWVTDFGLAQFQTDASLTVSGDLIGTVRYMSPEQALANRVLIDHRTDIYSLGVTLYELLTLRPAFAGKDRQELLRQITFEEPSRPRRLNRAIPPELETIVLKAMEKNPADRYATARDLADDLRRWLEDKPIQARRPSLVQRARKWGQRHRAMVRTAAVCLLVTLAVLAGSVGWVVRDQAARRTETEREANAALEEATKWQGEGRLPEALAAARRAAWVAETGTAGAAFRQRVQARRADLELVAELEEARLQMTAVKEEHFDSELGDRLFAQAFQRAGLDVEVLPVEEAAERIRQSSVPVELAAVLDDWALTRMGIRGQSDSSCKHLWRVARGADPDAWRDRMRQALERADKQALLDLAGSEEVTRQPSRTLDSLADALLGMEAAEPAQALLQQARQEHADDFWVNHHLAWAFVSTHPPRYDEALRFYTAAAALRPQSPGTHYNLACDLQELGRLDEAIAEYHEAIRLKKDDVGAHYNLGNALQDKGQLDEAIAEYREAIRIKKELPEAHNNLGNALRDKGRLDEAIAEYREAIRLKKDSPKAHSNLGNALREKGRLDEAIAECQEAIRLKKDYAPAHNNLGAALHEKGRLNEAIAEYREAIRLKKDYAMAHSNLGDALRLKGKLDEAIAECQEAIRLKKDFPDAHNGLGIALAGKGRLDEAIAEFREAIRLKKDYPEAHCSLGVALRSKGRTDEAIAEYREAIRLKKDLSVAHNNLGNALRDKGQLEEGIAEYREAIRLKKDDPLAHCNLGDTLRDKGQLDEAIAEIREAIRLNKEFPGAHNSLGNVLREKGRLEEAIAEFREAIRLRKDYPEAHANLGNALLDKGRLDEAIAEYREAIRLKKDLPEAHIRLGVALADRGQLDEAIAECQEAIRLKKDFAAAHCYLGHVLLQQGQFANALTALKHGHELGSKDPGWAYPSAQWVRTAEQLVAMETKLPQLLKGEAQPADNAERLALAHLCQQQKRLAAATRMYAEAFAAEPKVAGDLKAGHRFEAACAAALAGCGQGQDVTQLDEPERARLRRQALAWLQADVAQYTSMVEKGPAQARATVRQQLDGWQGESDFIGARAALGKLPEAEQLPWQKLWAEIGALRQRAAKPPEPASSSRP
jgi:tetratricopeptide (TPR) repeat protein